MVNVAITLNPNICRCQLTKKSDFKKAQFGISKSDGPLLIAAIDSFLSFLMVELTITNMKALDWTFKEASRFRT